MQLSMLLLVASQALCFLPECSHLSCGFSFFSSFLWLHSLPLTRPLKTKRQPTVSKGHNGLTQIERSFHLTCRMIWSITSWDLDLIAILGGRNNYLAWRKHLSSVCLSWFSVQCTCQTVALYFFCLLHKSAFPACHPVFFWISCNSDFATPANNHCHITFPSSITSSKEARTESSRFSPSLITLIVVCYNAVRHKPFSGETKFLQLRGVYWCLLTLSQNSTFTGETGRTNQQLKFLCSPVNQRDLS